MPFRSTAFILVEGHESQRLARLLGSNSAPPTRTPATPRLALHAASSRPPQG